MIVKTSRPILYDGSYEHYLSLDGSSTKDAILAFQKWANSKGEKLVDEDGIWSASTSKLYSTVQKRYELETGEQIGRLKPNYTPSSTVVDAKGRVKSFNYDPSNTGENKIQQETIPMKPYTGTYTPDKLKVSWWAKRSKAQKGLIIGGGIAVIAVIGFLIYKQTKK
jgi:hypothetical protein